MGLVPDDHDPQGDGNYIEMRLDFQMPPDGGDVVLGQVQVHVHHVPENQFIDALLIMARQALQRSMVENMFKDSVPPEIREFAAGTMATKFLQQRLEHPDLKVINAVDFVVPDDASELFEGNDQ